MCIWTCFLKKPALRHWNPLECGYSFQMNSERKIPLWWEFHSAATSLSLYTKEGHLRRVCVFLKGDHWPHTSLLAVVGPAEGKNLSSMHYSRPSGGFALLPTALHSGETMIKQEKKLWKLRLKWALIQVLLVLVFADRQCNMELTDFGMDFDSLLSLLIKMTDRARLRPTQCRVKVSATVFLSDWHVSQHPERGCMQTAASVLCIPPLWWTDRLVKRGMSALIYSLPGEDWWRYLNPTSVTTNPSCTLAGCSPPLPTADGYGFMSAVPVFSYWTYSIQ